MSRKQFYAFQMHTRGGELADRHPMHYGALFKEYAVDMYCKVLMHNLNEHRRLAGRNMRAAARDQLAQGGPGNEAPSANEGRKFKLGSSFVGSSAAQRKLFREALAVAREHGKPSLFVTFTCNPAWPEIVANLEPGQTGNDRPDIVNRVFRLKLKALLQLIKDEQVFGRVVALVAVVEFQKRGLPHAHLLITLAPEDAMTTPGEIDTIIRAQLPDQHTEPRLYQLVTKHMMHGPCTNRPCRRNAVHDDDRCSQKYPMPFNARTRTDNAKSTYAQYARPNNGRPHEKMDSTTTVGSSRTTRSCCCCSTRTSTSRPSPASTSTSTFTRDRIARPPRFSIAP